MNYFKNKVAVVTGGSDGIGKALVELLLKQGACVATCGRNSQKLYELQSRHPGNCLHIMSADVSKEDDCKKFISSAIEAFGTIHILINNAGISMRALFKDTDLQTLRNVVDVNFWGTVYCSKFALNEIIKNKGTIAGISSVAGFRGLPGRTGYSAAKFAVNGFLEALRIELMNEGVNVLWISPGFTTSNIRNVALDKDARPQKENPVDEAQMMSAEECAQHILQAIEKGKRSEVFTFLGKRTVWMSKLFPAWTDKLIRKFYFKGDKLVK